jgi:hypothetical protein
MAESNVPKDLEVRLTELENAVKALTDASKAANLPVLGGGLTSPTICYYCSGCYACRSCYACGACGPCGLTSVIDTRF